MMSFTITDPALLKQFAEMKGTVTLETPDGDAIGTLTVFPDGKLPPGVTCPFTDEQRREFRKQRDGRPLKDILRDLKARG